MENWIILALFSWILAGIYSFCLKIVAERWYDTYIVTFYDYLIGAWISWLYLIYYLSYTDITLSHFLFNLMLAFINVTFFSLSIISRVEAMRNIDSVIFFPLYKTFWPILVTITSVFLFKEVLNLKEFLGIICGILVPLMLITKTENRIQKNLLLWVILVIATSILTTISSIGIKELMVRNLSVELFVFLSFAMGTILSLIWYEIHKRKSKKRYQTQWIFKFGIWVSLIHLTSFIIFVLALEGNLAIVFTINSFSILVPIILSIIFYGEHFNLKKWIVIALSIVSILLFI